ncbi:hypothetical protein EK21DRAFT_59214 [Setomelanomma holmii]|uniref:Uncharacterized protein n=1 Tax=Setomelanomma holmii TaxID=210430 RepID=A0A9P4HGI6_9PLEO|nr:hypothetical protein EK21DRAFT_59214 [Setomelanomma holmii]
MAKNSGAGGTRSTSALSGFVGGTTSFHKRKRSASKRCASSDTKSSAQPEDVEMVNTGEPEAARSGNADSFSSKSSRRNLGPRDTISMPLDDSNLPEPQECAALFLPADAKRFWYLGFLEDWQDFNKHALKFWKSDKCQSAFANIQHDLLLPPRSTERDLAEISTGDEHLKTFFQRDVLEVVQAVWNKLLQIKSMRGDNVPQQLQLGNLWEIDLGNDQTAWQPSFVVKAPRSDCDDEPRLLGQVEYLGGMKEALTWAIKEATRNTWGSLRCVLGDIASYMLLSSTRYGFIVSANEIIFLRFECREKVEYDVPDPEEDDPIDLFVEPWLSYSQPISFGEVLNETEGQEKVPVKLALLYVLYLGTQEGWDLYGEYGECRSYGEYTKAGERYVPPKPSCMKF